MLGMLIGMILGLGFSPLFGALAPLITDATQRGWAFHPVKMHSPQDLINLRYRGIIEEKQYENWMKENGFDEEKAEQLYKGAETLLNASELITAKWRGIIDEKEYYNRMEKIGITKENASKLEQISKYYPSAQDFIRFAVRDVFDEDVVKRYGYDEKFPTAIVPYAQKTGVSEEQLKWYWRAHWELPSVREGFEMLHRRVINKDDLEVLLKIADIAPYWVDKLIKISYFPYTRVDVRRMYRAGVLSKEQVYNSYLDLGYDEEHAKNLTDWTTMESLSEERDLTKSEILTAYIDKEISRSDALKYLQQMGYDENEADLIISIREKREERRLIREELRVLKWEYAWEIKTKDDLIKRFNELNFNESRKKLLLREFDLFKRRHPPKKGKAE